MNKAVLKKLDPFEFLRIALFDVWMANEDRVCNNPNLMIYLKSGKWSFLAIDHGMCFNSNSGRKLCQVTTDDSILAHSLFKCLINRKSDIDTAFEKLENEYSHAVFECNQKSLEVIEKIPSDWNFNKGSIKDFLDNNVFSQSWIDNTWKNFKFIVDYYRRKK